MADTSIRRAAALKHRELTRGIGTELRRMRLDTGLSQRAIARAVDLDHSHLSMIEAGLRAPSLDALARTATAMGMDVSVRFYPSSGRRLRDHVQARMGEGLLRVVDPRWHPFPEVAVYRASRGVIDLVLADPVEHQLAITELQSEIRAVDQQLRWAQVKAEAIESARAWPFGLPHGASASTVRLLVLRNSQRNRDLVRDLAQTFAAAYPASLAETVQALTDAPGPLPGHALLWLNVDTAGVRLLDAPPRGITVGR
jgi:transcriptional regulator with XRE-family HTH domain